MDRSFCRYLSKTEMMSLAQLEVCAVRKAADSIVSGRVSACRRAGVHECKVVWLRVLYVRVVQDKPPDALTQQLEAMPPELQQVLLDMQGLANVSAAEFGLLDIQQTRKNSRSAMNELRLCYDIADVVCGLKVSCNSFP